MKYRVIKDGDWYYPQYKKWYWLRWRGIDHDWDWITLESRTPVLRVAINICESYEARRLQAIIDKKERRRHVVWTSKGN